MFRSITVSQSTISIIQNSVDSSTFIWFWSNLSLSRIRHDTSPRRMLSIVVCSQGSSSVSPRLHDRFSCCCSSSISPSFSLSSIRHSR